MSSGVYERKKEDNIKRGIAISKALTGKPCSEKRREGISNARKGKLFPYFTFKNHHHSKKSKVKIRNKLIQYFQDHHQKTKGTLIEKIMKEIIKDWKRMGAIKDFLEQIQIGRYLVDFLILNKFNQLEIIECFGKRWHSGFAKKYKDMKRKQRLEKLGFIVKIFWSKEIFKFRDSYGRKFIE